MARKAKGNGSGEQSSTPGMGHNGDHELNEEQKIKQYYDSYGPWVAAREALSIIEENAKARLGKHAIRDFRTTLATKSESGEEKLTEQVQSVLRLARWEGLSLGSQAEMFQMVDRAPLDDKAFADGKMACLRNEPRKPPHDPSTSAYSRWMAGYDEGQSKLMEGFKAPANDTEEDLRPRFKQHQDA